MLKPSVPTKFTDKTGNSENWAVPDDGFAWMLMRSLPNVIGD